MFDDSWSQEDQLVVERLAKKFGVDLKADELAGAEATFTSIETAARKIGQAVTRRVTEDLAIQQTQLLEGPQPCPTCGKSCEAGFKERELTTGDGPIELREAVCHCSACRRDFFPSTRSLEASPTRL
ncbi:MAG: hypothetical protein KY475_25420 [Planctomycetes bacterium]|nr:hypothetical protein [Planctomycetota bacterium]